MPVLAPKKTKKYDASRGGGWRKKSIYTMITSSPSMEERSSKAKLKRLDLIMFTTQLSVMLDSGVILSDALDTISEQANEGTFRTIIRGVNTSVKNGDSFSNALAGYPKVFSSMFISMVRASEASGRMPEMLHVLAGYLEFEFEIRKRIKGAIAYPLMMALIAMVATCLLIFFVLPRFMKIYESRGAALPKLTQLLINISDLFRNFQFLTIMFTVSVFVAVAVYKWSKTINGRRAIDYAKIHIPILGGMFVDMIIARSMRIMATMISTGVSILETVEVVHGATKNYYFQQLWSWVDEKIRNGYQLTEAMQIYPQSGLIEPAILQMLKAGEKSGNIGKVSNKISLFYEKKLESSIVSATKILEPLLLIIIGGIIGIIAIALLLPVFRISSIIAH